MANYVVSTETMTGVADVIRGKAGTSAPLEFPEEWKSTIEAIETGVDTSGDTVTPATLFEGVTAHNAAGEQITGAAAPIEAGYTDEDKFIERTLEAFSDDTITSIGGGAFTGCSMLSIVTANSVEQIPSGAFSMCTALTSAFFSNATTIGYSAFYRCTALATTHFEAVTEIGGSAFARCLGFAGGLGFPAAITIGVGAFYGTRIKSTGTRFPLVSSIGSSAFQSTELMYVEMSNVDTLYQSAFANCTALHTAIFPKVTLISGSFVFSGCSLLKNVSFPLLDRIYGNAFFDCMALQSVSFPLLTDVTGAFSGCTSLQDVSVPLLARLGTSAFRNCISLSSISLPAATSIYSGAFYNCQRLISLYLLGSTVATLFSSNAFTSTPIGGYSTVAGQYGSIYVPASLLASYRTATNWAYFSGRFVGV